MSCIFLNKKKICVISQNVLMPEYAASGSGVLFSASLLSTFFISNSFPIIGRFGKL
jgi:hypothetical protein